MAARARGSMTGGTGRGLRPSVGPASPGDPTPPPSTSNRNLNSGNCVHAVAWAVGDRAPLAHPHEKGNTAECATASLRARSHTSSSLVTWLNRDVNITNVSYDGSTKHGRGGAADPGPATASV